MEDVRLTNAMENKGFKISQYACAVLLIVSSIALVAYQVIEIEDVAAGLLYYVAQSFLLAGSIFTFEIKGGQEEAWRFIDALQIFSLLANVADVKSLVIHPYTTTHSQLSPEELAEQHITPSTVRLSIGTEHIDDIIDDLAQALDKI